MLESVLKASMIFIATFPTKEYKWYQYTYLFTVLQHIISKVNQLKKIEKIEEIGKGELKVGDAKEVGFVDRLNYRYGGWTEDFRAAVILPGNIVVIG